MNAHVTDTKIYAHSGAKCGLCRKKIAYGEMAKLVVKGTIRKFLHPKCYQKWIAEIG